MPTKQREQIAAYPRRTFSMDSVEVRGGTDGKPYKFRGHSAVFDTPTWIGPKRWGFYEQVATGAFTKTIGEHDVRFLYNHEPDSVMARNTAGDLTLSEDDIGLLTEADLAPDDLDVQRLVPKLRNKHVTQMSFGFEVISDLWETNSDTGVETRTILEVKLWDVSPVTFPAYEETDASLRAVAFDVLSARMGLTTSKRSRLIAGIADGDLDPELAPLLREASRSLASLASEAAPDELHAATDEPAAPDELHAERTVPLSVLRLRHDLKAKSLA